MDFSDERYMRANQKLWDAKTDIHYASSFYDNEAFIKGKNSLNPLELEEMGDVDGKRMLHLQCHFGQDTLSWARMGALATGIDFSATAIKRADQLAASCGIKARFIQSNIYDLPSVLHEKFDIVFTSYGVLGWLPDLTRWAAVVSEYLKPGGLFYMVEFHPILWMFDDNFQTITYPYHTRYAMEFDEKGTYTNRDAPVKGKSYNWNHSLSAIIDALLSRGMSIDFFHEHLYSPYNIFPRPVPKEGGLWAIEGLDGVVPMLFSVKAVASI